MSDITLRARKVARFRHLIDKIIPRSDKAESASGIVANPHR